LLNSRRTGSLAFALLLLGSGLRGDSPLPVQVHRLPHGPRDPAVATVTAPRPSQSAIADALRRSLSDVANVGSSDQSLKAKTENQGRTADPAGAVRRAGSGTPLQLRNTQPGGRTLQALSTRGPDGDVETAREFLRRSAGALHLADPDQELVLSVGSAMILAALIFASPSSFVERPCGRAT
jgi:hypothetical protein